MRRYPLTARALPLLCMALLCPVSRAGGSPCSEDIPFRVVFPGRAHAVFSPAERIRCSVRFPAPSGMSRGLILRYRVTDFYGKETVSSRRADIAVNDGTAGADIVVDSLPLGWYQVTLEVFDGLKKMNLVNASVPGCRPWFTFMVISAAGNSSSGGAFGINEHFLDERVAHFMRLMGIRWLRTGVLWQFIEYRPNEFDWSRMDNIMALAKEHDLEVLPVVAYSPCWASRGSGTVETPQCSYSAPRKRYYGRFLEKLISRYRDNVLFWEIWNEPNAYFWVSSEEEYAALLRHSADLIRKLDEDCGILMGGVSGTSPEWIRMLQEKAGGSFDIYNIHPYFYPREPEDKLQVDLNDFWGVASKAADKTVWITEMGIPTNTASIQDQARQLVRSMVMVLSAGVSRCFWYELKDAACDEEDKEANFGLLFSDFSPKPAFVAFTTLSRVLSHAKFERRLPIPSSTVYGYLFRKQKESIIVLWTTRERENIRLNNVEGPITITDIMGNEQVLDVSVGAIRLELTNNPSYLQFSDG